MSAIPPVDLTQQFKTIAAEVNVAVMDVLSSGRYIHGPAEANFLKAFGDYIGTPHSVGCNSGTDALYLALRALDIGPGDEVITSPFTFIATAETISAVGATPVFVDIDLDSFNIDPEAIAAAITPKTKAIMPVHLFGLPADMDAVMAVAEAHNLPVIEDCAQATGANWRQKRVGSVGHMGCFSFFPTKNLGGCGDGGALLTSDEALAAKATMIREHGSQVKYKHEAIGINSRLDTLQACILLIKLRYLDEWNARRTAIATRYTQLLEPIPGLVRPSTIAHGTSVWNQYTIRLEMAADSGEKRDQVRQQLQSKGIISMVYYPIPLHLQSIYSHLGYGPGSLPKAEQAARQVLSLPMFPELSVDQQTQVVYGLKEVLMEMGA